MNTTNWFPNRMKYIFVESKAFPFQCHAIKKVCINKKKYLLIQNSQNRPAVSIREISQCLCLFPAEQPIQFLNI